MQRAIDRAYLIERHGEVWKHARLTDLDYRQTEFIAEYPREGGIFLDAVRDSANAVIDRIAVAIRPVFAGAARRGLQEYVAMEAQLTNRRDYVHAMQQRTPRFEDVAADPPPNWATAYSSRSIVKEIDQLVTQITARRLEQSSVAIALNGQQAHLPFEFTPALARRFHKIAAQRELGAAMIVRATIRSLDRGNKYTRPSAKIVNLATNREVSLRLSGRSDCEVLHPFHDGQEVRLFVCPIVEALGFDLNGGDLMFIAVV